MSSNKVNGYDWFLIAVLLAVLACLLTGVLGCVQHIADVTITEHLRQDGTVHTREVKVHAGHTAVAADSKIGKAKLDTPSGWGFELWDFSKYLDSLEAGAITPAGKFDLKTSEGK